MLHFTYAPDLNQHQLMQGDVLQRTEEFDKILKDVHPHFYEHSKNLYFLVLTQSCDLAPHLAGGKCKARYISIAPVRSLDLVLERHIAANKNATVRAELPVLSEKSRNKSNEFLSRLFNNNELGYFYLESSNTKLQNDCVAFLNLSIALRSEEHLQKCLDAKILQLAEPFQAKLGWLVGQMYSRVGTEDWPTDPLNKKIRESLRDAALWIDDKKLAIVEKHFLELLETDQDKTLTAEEVKRIVAKAPTLKQKVLSNTQRVIDEVLVDSPELADRLRRRLENDAALTAALKS